MEPRARAGKNAGKMNFSSNELSQLLYSHGDVIHPLPDTIRALDEILTDFIQAVAFEASGAAQHKSRQKLKLEDFEFALRNNPEFLGKVQEVFEKKGEIERAKKAFTTDDDVELSRRAAAADNHSIPASAVCSAIGGVSKRGRTTAPGLMAPSSFSNAVFHLGKVEEVLNEGDDYEDIGP